MACQGRPAADRATGCSRRRLANRLGHPHALGMASLSGRRGVPDPGGTGRGSSCSTAAKRSSMSGAPASSGSSIPPGSFASGPCFTWDEWSSSASAATTSFGSRDRGDHYMVATPGTLRRHDRPPGRGRRRGRAVRPSGAWANGHLKAFTFSILNFYYGSLYIDSCRGCGRAWRRGHGNRAVAAVVALVADQQVHADVIQHTGAVPVAMAAVSADPGPLLRVAISSPPRSPAVPWTSAWPN